MENDLSREALLNELQELRRREQELLKKLEMPSKQNEVGLSHSEIFRYGRQLLLPEMGMKCQLKLKHSNGVLIVGGGGLGCPALQYLASSGVSPIGVVDYDTVDLSNLHRQILHHEGTLGQSKVDSMVQAIQLLNSTVKVVPYKTALDSKSALEIVKMYDVVLDASDNVATRYLLNDACVILDKPLVSGSALRFEGQLTVYNYKGGPTYRCLYPEPPPAETVTNCSDGGVLGPVPGVIGTLQALEAIKILGNFGQVLSGRMLLFDGLYATFRTVKLRGRKPETLEIKQLVDYEQFCGAKATDKEESLKLLKEHERLNVHEYKSMVDNSEQHVLLDVRNPAELDICGINKDDTTVNIPLGDIEQKAKEKLDGVGKIIVVCRKGNDSQVAVVKLKQLLSNDTVIKDISGGLYAWADNVDSSMPKY